MIGGLLPAVVASVTGDDRESREYRISIPGITDGAAVMPRAQLCNPIGDNSEETEIRIKPGDRVWIAFEAGDTRYPVIVGFRPRNVENGIDWRRFFQTNFQFNADNTFEVIAGTQVHIKTPLAFVEADMTHISKDVVIDGKLTVKELLTFEGGMNGSGGAGGPAMVVSGGAAFSDEVIAGGIPVGGHHHTEHDGPPTGEALA